MKRLISLALIMIMTLTLMNGCKKDEAQTQVANPVHECDVDEMTKETGVALDAPEGAEDVQYSYIEGDEKIAQVSFTLDGKDYCYRAKMTSEILDMGNSDPDANILDVEDEMKASIESGEALSGCYEKWTMQGLMDVSYCTGVYAIKNKSLGFLTWFDVVPGIQYSVSMDNCTSAEDLLHIAELCFVPAQGEVE